MTSGRVVRSCKEIFKIFFKISDTTIYPLPYVWQMLKTKPSVQESDELVLKSYLIIHNTVQSHSCKERNFSGKSFSPNLLPNRPSSGNYLSHVGKLPLEVQHSPVCCYFYLVLSALGTISRSSSSLPCRGNLWQGKFIPHHPPVTEPISWLRSLSWNGLVTFAFYSGKLVGKFN